MLFVIITLAKRTRSSNDVEEEDARKKNTKKKEAKSKKSKNDRVEEVKRRKDGTLIFKDHPEFRPNLTPTQVISKGAFGVPTFFLDDQIFFGKDHLYQLEEYINSKK